MPVLPTLEAACRPRPSVFEQRAADTVYNIDDLDQIDPVRFFTENWVTDGMRRLLTEAFRRLEGRSSSAAGSFLLSQSMGGGKTHNLIALGLLARHPEWRERVMRDFYTPGPLGAVRVVTFSGRKTHTPFGIWGEIAGQLNRKDALRDFYAPLQPPGDDDWIGLLRGDPVLILLDELPPYFEAAQAIQIGATTLDTITTTALANLLVAVNSNKLPNVCVVLTDLSGTAYAKGSDALANLEKELNRGIQRIDPVQLNTNELYHILRTRLFESLPPEDEVNAVADAYRAEVERARLMSYTAASPDSIRSDVASAYPFHPAIRDLFARFRENPGYQQTRALIRIMRLMVADLWTSGRARRQHLIGAHDFDLHQQDVLSEVRQINGSLQNAVAHDIASEGRTSVAEQVDRAESSDAQDVSRLVFLSSLSQAVNPTLGLDRSEIVTYLAAPGRDLGNLNAVIDRLQTEAWYLHPAHYGRLLFKNTENLIAKLETYTRGALPEQREGELRTRLEEMFRPALSVLYQKVQALPALDEVEPSQDSITLVIFRPSSQALEDIRRFFEHVQYRNRVLFLTGNPAAYGTVLQRAAELKAIRSIVKELREDGRKDTDPQMEEALTLATKKESAFYQACRETFQTLYYPSARGLTPLELDLKYVANQYNGEVQIMTALKDVSRFTEDTGADSTFRATLERKLWPGDAREASWSDIRRRAATDPSWVWHHPRALESLKDELIKRDIWRQNGNFIDRGPFERPTATVSVRVMTRSDNTGEVVLRVQPQHADTVYMSKSGPATTASEKLDRFDFPITALRLSFLAVDSTGVHETGEPVTWQNTITLKYKIFPDGPVRRCELRAAPGAAVRYTTDGSAPDTLGQSYTETFAVPDGCRFIQAIAEADGIRSDVLRIDVPPARGSGAGGKVAPIIDPARPAVWKRAHRLGDTHAAYTWLETIRRHDAQIGGLALVVMKRGDDNCWVDFRTGPGVLQGAAAVVEHADRLKVLIPDGSLNLEAELLRFETGRDLEDTLRDLKIEPDPAEVSQ